jgi:hypothetical protein
MDSSVGNIVLERDQEFCFEHTIFEMVVKQHSRTVKSLEGYVHLRLREEGLAREK